MISLEPKEAESSNQHTVYLFTDYNCRSKQICKFLNQFIEIATKQKTAHAEWVSVITAPPFSPLWAFFEQSNDESSKTIQNISRITKVWVAKS